MVEDYKTKVRVRSVKKRISNINSALRVSIWVSLGISSALVLFCAVAYVTSSQLFHVKNISIKGCSQVQVDEILSLLDIEKGDNILASDIDVARQRILEHPWVREVSIVRRFMPAALIVTIREHVPVAAIYIGDKGYVVNSEGRIFASMPKTYHGFSMRAVGYVPNGQEMNTILKTGIEAVDLLRSKGLPVDTLEVEAGGLMTFRLRNGNTLACVGSITPTKLDMALTVIRQLKPVQGTILDLSCEDKVVLSHPSKGDTYGS